MDLSGLPHFIIDEIRPAPDGAEAHLVGRFTHLRGVRNDLGYLYRSVGPSVVGMLATLPTTAGESLVFITPDWKLAPELQPGVSYPWLDGYWQPYHIAMILAGQWTRRTFAATPARYFRLNGVIGWQPDGAALPEGAEDLGLRDGAWDHEHCELCRAHIGGPGSPQGYVDPEEHWLCLTCHERYAVPRDLLFAADDA